MDPNAVLRPVGPQPARVYWVRRLVLLAVLLVLVIAVAKACSGGDAKPAASSTGTTPTATPTPTPSPTRAPGCLRRDLTVTAGTDASTYPGGVTPRLSAVVRNVSDHPCRFRTSAGDRVWTIVSGADQVWSSADCTPKGSIARSRLRAGKTIAYALIWNRHRSAKGCPSDSPEAPRGTYQLRVTINGVAADTVVFHLTD